MSVPTNVVGTGRATKIWCARVPSTDEDIPGDLYHAWLTYAEKQRLAQFRTAELRRQYLLTRALCRDALSRCHPTPPADWQFATNAFGKPKIAAPADARGLRFNLSNTPEWVVCAVASGPGELGVDIERIDNGTADPTIAKRYFAPREAASLEGLDDADARTRFMRLWTLKEAYVKARGLGLSLDLDRFEVDPDASPIRLRCDADVDADPGAWQFGLLRLGTDHVLAIASRGCGDLPANVEEITPGA